MEINKLTREDLVRLLKKPVDPILLDLGCGSKKRDGYIGLDKVSLNGVDIVADLESGIPLEDNSVDGVSSTHFFEHINNIITLFKEIYRVCKNGSIIEFTVPYFTSIGAFQDPTHVRFFNENTLLYFTINQPQASEYNIKTNFKILKISYSYYQPFLKYFPFMSFFRRHFWNIAADMHVKLMVIKE